ncbi:class A beta-lactamase-related serine hydrolase [Janibacter melonis]|uniref:serine hydrolase n=1 Tax=Janibacter melonis TaxID=262209 RepID=UPI00204485A9|nr:serine hydrolase [Janibacter melonis]MCM3556796.1 class A beta-lactamase-related serine hydrolase [Janibacter melonis]
MNRLTQAGLEIAYLAQDTGIDVHVHARRIDDDPDEVALASETPTPMASLYKVAVAGCWSQLVASGQCDPLAEVVLEPSARTAGPTGVSALQDRVVLTQRDCVRLALALSDNECSAAILALIGPCQVQTWLAQIGCQTTHARRGTADAMRAVLAETGGRDLGQALALLADPARDRTTSEYDPALTSSSTARDLTTMLTHLWREEYAAPVRDGMRRQAWRHRIASGFPHDDVVVAGKTGTLGRLRHEIAVIEIPGEVPIAISVLTRSLRPETHQPRIDAAIGAIAQTAVHPLRKSNAA